MQIKKQSFWVLVAIILTIICCVWSRNGLIWTTISVLISALVTGYLAKKFMTTYNESYTFFEPETKYIRSEY